MAPNVKLDGGVWSSVRMIALGQALGTSVYDAVGRMGLLWQTCTERQSAVLPDALVRAVVDPDLVIAADLGERVDAGIRIKGTTGRIEWYGKLQESGKKGAAKRWKKKPDRVAMGSPSGGDGDPVVIEVGVDPVVEAGSSSPDAPRRRRKQPETELPAEWQPSDDHVALAAELSVDLAAEAAKFRAHAETKGRRAARWGAAFTLWLHNAAEYAQQRGGGGRRHGVAKGTPAVRDRAAELLERANQLEAEGR